MQLRHFSPKIATSYNTSSIWSGTLSSLSAESYGTRRPESGSSHDDGQVEPSHAVGRTLATEELTLLVDIREHVI